MGTIDPKLIGILFFELNSYHVLKYLTLGKGIYL